MQVAAGDVSSAAPAGDSTAAAASSGDTAASAAAVAKQSAGLAAADLVQARAANTDQPTADSRSVDRAFLHIAPHVGGAKSAANGFGYHSSDFASGLGGSADAGFSGAASSGWF